MKKITFILIYMLTLCNLHIVSQTMQGMSCQGETPPPPQTIKKAASDFSFDDVLFWAGEGENEAILIVDFHFNDEDGKTGMAWGYRWPEGETATGFDMITSIAKADPRFLVMVQETNLGYTINGIGFGYLRNYFNIEYNLDGASTDPKVSFKFDSPNTFLGQTHCPENPLEEISAATEEGIKTGVINHPFNYTNYGYACYDYDHWLCTNSDAEWQSGWYEGYWSYLIKDNINEDFAYSGVGAILRVLQNGSVDSWGYQDFSNPSYAGVSPREPYLSIRPMVLIDNALESAEKTMEEEAALLLTYSVHPVSATTQKATWSSSDMTVASIDNNGLVTALKKGTAVITASIEGEDIQPFSYTITVKEKNILNAVPDSKEHISIAIYNGTLHISGCENYIFKIYNLNGQLIKEFNPDGAMFRYDISNLKGTYVLKGNNGNNLVTKKITH